MAGDFSFKPKKELGDVIADLNTPDDIRLKSYITPEAIRVICQDYFLGLQKLNFFKKVRLTLEDIDAIKKVRSDLSIENIILHYEHCSEYLSARMP